jgi:hypothetical protein
MEAADRGPGARSLRGRWARLRAEPECGAGVIEFIVIFVGLVVPLVWAIVTMAGVQRAMLGTSGAAREAGRVFAVSGNEAQGRALALQSADDILANHQLETGTRRTVELTVTCPAPEPCDGGFGRGAMVEVTVTYRVPVAGFLQPIVGVDLPVRATHRTRVDRYRSLP